MKNRNLYILITIVIIIILLTFVFIFSKIIKKDDFLVNSFEISLDSNIKKESFKDLGPIDDESIDSVIPYQFSIRSINKGNQTYMLLIEDIIDNDNENNNLTRNYLRYELRLNNEIVKRGNLSEISNNILDRRAISKNEVNKYSLKIWISSNAKDIDWMNKYYSYNISVKPSDI